MKPADGLGLQVTCGLQAQAMRTSGTAALGGEQHWTFVRPSAALGRMTSAREQLLQAYQPLIGHRLTGLAWMPLPSDTPDLVREFRGSSFSFTGGVQLRFEPDLQLFLTWRSKTPMTLETGAEEERWGPWALDRIGPHMNSAWTDVLGTTLIAVDLFTSPERWTDGLAPLNGAPVGARHRLEGNGAVCSFWVGTAYGNNIREGDDLWVGLNIDPDNMADLELVASLVT